MAISTSLQNSQGQSTGMGQSSGATQSNSQSNTQVLPQLFGGYQDLLGQNEQHYGNMLDAYNQGQSQLQGALPGIQAGYDTLGQNIQNTLGMGGALGQNGNWGVAGPAFQAINQNAARQAGQTTQGMTNAGLGNTTAVANAQNQNQLFQNQAIGGLGAQLAQTAAGYQAQIGQAKQAAGMQGLGMMTGLTQGALGPMNSQLGNTMGGLTGNFGNSASVGNNQSTSAQQSTNTSHGTSSSVSPSGGGSGGGSGGSNGFGLAPQGGGSSGGGLGANAPFGVVGQNGSYGSGFGGNVFGGTGGTGSGTTGSYKPIGQGGSHMGGGGNAGAFGSNGSGGAFGQGYGSGGVASGGLGGGGGSGIGPQAGYNAYQNFQPGAIDPTTGQPFDPNAFSANPDIQSPYVEGGPTMDPNSPYYIDPNADQSGDYFPPPWISGAISSDPNPWGGSGDPTQDSNSPYYLGNSADYWGGKVGQGAYGYGSMGDLASYAGQGMYDGGLADPNSGGGYSSWLDQLGQYDQPSDQGGSIYDQGQQSYQQAAPQGDGYSSGDYNGYYGGSYYGY